MTFLNDARILILEAPVLPFVFEMLSIQSFCEQTGDVVLVWPAFSSVARLSLTVVESISFGGGLLGFHFQLWDLRQLVSPVK